MNETVRAKVQARLDEKQMSRADLARATEKTPQAITRALNGTQDGGTIPPTWTAILDALDLELTAQPKAGGGMNYLVVVAVELYDREERFSATAHLERYLILHGLAPGLANILNKRGDLIDDASLPAGMFVGNLVGESARAVRADTLQYCLDALDICGLSGKVFTFVSQQTIEDEPDIGFESFIWKPGEEKA